MPSESASVPKLTEVEMSDGSKVEVSPLKTGGWLAVCRVLKETNVDASSLMRKSLTKRVCSSTDCEWKKTVGKTEQAEAKCPECGETVTFAMEFNASGIWMIPEIVMACVSASAGMTEAQVNALPIQDSAKIVAVIAKQTDMTAIADSLKNVASAFRGLLKANG